MDKDQRKQTLTDENEQKRREQTEWTLTEKNGQKQT